MTLKRETPTPAERAYVRTWMAECELEPRKKPRPYDPNYMHPATQVFLGVCLLAMGACVVATVVKSAIAFFRYVS